MKTGKLPFRALRFELRGLLPMLAACDCHQARPAWRPGFVACGSSDPSPATGPLGTPGALILGEPQLVRTRRGHFFVWQSQVRGHLKTVFQGFFFYPPSSPFHERGFLLVQPLFGDSVDKGTILLE